MFGLVWIIVAGLLAALAGIFIGEAVYAEVHRRSSTATLLMPTKQQALILQLQNGIRLLRKPSAAILRMSSIRNSVDDAVALLDEKGIAVTNVALTSVVMGASILFACIAGIVSASFVFGIAASCLVVAGLMAYVKRVTDKQNLEMREKVPDALRSFATCFRSGLSLLQTMQQSSKEMGGRLGRILQVSAQRLEVGATTTEALAVLQGNSKVPELSFIAVALDVQHQSGGSLAPVLESAKDSVDSELELMRSLRVQTAQAKLSASIVTIMPFVLVALFSLMSPGFLSPFFSSFMGVALLVLALVMQIAGVLMVRHMLAIDAR